MVLFEKFLSKQGWLHNLYFSRKNDSSFGCPCDCGQGPVNMTCHDCDKYPGMCEECFIEYHRFNPLHWPRVWDQEWGFLVCCDISVLRQRTCAINMSSCEGQCCRFGPPPLLFPWYPHQLWESSSYSLASGQSEGVIFTIVDCNRIHSTHVRFCWCEGDPNQVEQLMSLGLFPATLDCPEMAFTFHVLKQFQIACLQGKISCYNFMDSLMCLIDGAFPFDVVVSLQCDSDQLVTDE